jgi:hypothetical protein
MVSPPVPPGLEDYTPFIQAVWGSSGTNVFAVGDWHHYDDYTGLDIAPYVAHYDGTAWSLPASSLGGGSWNGVWGSSPNDVYAVAIDYDDQNDSRILHFDGNKWSSVLFEIDLTLLDIWGSSASDVYAIGSTGTGVGAIWHFDGRSWSALTSPTTHTFGAIWGSSASDIFMIAGRQTIWHFDGAKWKQVYNSTSALYDIWGSSSSDVYVVGENGTILHGTP